jgi:CheY-like chemotaxis protein
MDKSINVLLVDDNDDDSFFIERAFQSAGVAIHIFRCIDGQEAINYLENKPPFSSASFHPKPDFVFLDLKLPVKDGFDVLSWIRGHKELSSLIVAILTSSAEKRDIERAYQLNANVYLTKPRSLQEMIDLAKSINLLWFQTCLRLLP